VAEGQARRPIEGYEPPTITIHGSLAEVTAANLIGTVFDKSIPAGSSIVAIFGGTSF
jgi:hypothetical protein